MLDFHHIYKMLDIPFFVTKVEYTVYLISFFFLATAEPGPPARPSIPQRLIVVPDPQAQQPNRYR